jgi:hypothetical protein
MNASDLLDEPDALQPAWVWEEFLAAGSLGALVAKPKIGKSTTAYELAIKVAQGLPYLGRATGRGAVLLLALEEHRREIKQRLRDLGAAEFDNVHLHIGPLLDTPTTFHEIHGYIRQHGIVLVVVDTLNSFWSVKEENDAVAVTAAVKPLLTLARESGAAVLLLHHARKSEGEFGDEIRGSSALFSLLDVALILKRHEIDTQRKLTAVSRYPDTPRELIIELREHGHESLGDPAAVGKAAKAARVQAALTDSPAPAKEIASRAGVRSGAAYAILNRLVDQGLAHRTGTGRRADPFLYCRCVSVSSPRGGGANETKGNAGPSGSIPDQPEAGGPGFVSFQPPILGAGQKRNQSEPETEERKSIRLTTTPPKTKRKSNCDPETEVEVIDLVD